MITRSRRAARAAASVRTALGILVGISVALVSAACGNSGATGTAPEGGALPNGGGGPDASMSGGNGNDGAPGGNSPDGASGGHDGGTHPDGSAGDSGSFSGPDVAKYVNPLIGTDGASVTPGALVPYGMVLWSPENTAGNQAAPVFPGGYGYNQTKIRGFALTHMSGEGCKGAYGDIPFFPYAGAVTSSPSSDTTDATFASTFSHTNEVAEAGYYKVALDSGVTAELTATLHTGSGRFTYPSGSTATMLIRASNSEVGSENAQVTVDPSGTITGSVTSGNFCGYINAVDRRSYYTVYFQWF
jgi:hypothetical protein